MMRFTCCSRYYIFFCLVVLALCCISFMLHGAKLLWNILIFSIGLDKHTLYYYAWVINLYLVHKHVLQTLLKSSGVRMCFNRISALTAVWRCFFYCSFVLKKKQCTNTKYCHKSMCTGLENNPPLELHVVPTSACFCFPHLSASSAHEENRKAQTREDSRRASLKGWFRSFSGKTSQFTGICLPFK